MMNGPETSDSAIVAEKPPNKVGSPGAEVVEPRAGTKGNADQQNTHRTQSRARVTQALNRVRQAARQRKKEQFFTKTTGYILLDQQLARLHRRKHELLRVLDRPEIPLHTNGSENDIRCLVTKRKISGGTVSEAGKIARDVMLGLAKTCAKLDISFWRFLGDRFCVPGAGSVPSLPGLVRLAAA